MKKRRRELFSSSFFHLSSSPFLFHFPFLFIFFVSWNRKSFQKIHSLLCLSPSSSLFLGFFAILPLVPNKNRKIEKNKNRKKGFLGVLCGCCEWKRRRKEKKKKLFNPISFPFPFPFPSFHLFSKIFFSFFFLFFEWGALGFGSLRLFFFRCALGFFFVSPLFPFASFFLNSFSLYPFLFFLFRHFLSGRKERKKKEIEAIFF